uniref:Uncharacterized protein n=1 Tax=Schistocephalus solidus TaxID=70667 RepID=A0A0X3NZC8_SCHSO
MSTKACFIDSSSYRNKLNNKDCESLIYGVPNDKLNVLDTEERSLLNKKANLQRRWKENVAKYNDELRDANERSILPYGSALEECDLGRDCKLRTEKKVVFGDSNRCGLDWDEVAKRNEHEGAKKAATEIIGPANTKNAPDKILMGKLRGMLCHDIGRKLPQDFALSQVFPEFPISNTTEPTDVQKKAIKFMYKTTTQSMYDDINFDLSNYSRLHYPLNTLERSADPLILSTLRNKGLPGTSSWQPQHLSADVYDKELLRRDFSKVSRPPDFCAQMRRAHQIASYSCEESLLRKEKQEDEALKKEIEKNKESWEAEQRAHPPAKLPGTYDPVIGSGAPQNWAPRVLSVDDLVSKKVEQKTLWQKAVDLPAPEPYCKRKVTFAPKPAEDTKPCQ